MAILGALTLAGRALEGDESMRRYPLLVLAALAALLVIGCSGEQPDEATAKSAPPAETEVETTIVEVAPTGNEFEPAIAVDRLPPGVWYCDMGTTHYARGEQDDGKCPVCGMTLVENAAETEDTDTGGGA
jgi:hypothetical protein